MLPSGVKNYLYPTDLADTANLINTPGSSDINRNLGQYAAPVPITRLRQDINSWRIAMNEIERVIIPFRFRMQQLYLDTRLNSQVAACMTRRKELTMLRDFKVCDEKGNESLELKSIFRNTTSSVAINEQATHWFDIFTSHALDSLAYGYSLISLGDLVNGGFPDLTILKRWLTSPDRFIFSAFPYSVDGKKFKEEPFLDWHIYIPTPSDHGISICGYGYLFEVAPYEIYLRNNMGYQADFNEVFNMPTIVGSTTKTKEEERDSFFEALKAAGSMKTILKDEATDTVEFIESKNVGTSFQSYEKFSERNEKNISKIILGHADAMESTPGKLGQSGNKKGVSPVDQALDAKQSTDGIFMQNVYNSMLLPRLRKMGFKIPLNYHIEFKNDSEIQEIKTNEVELNAKYAAMALSYFQAGYRVDPGYLTEQTGINITEIPVQAATEVKPL